MMSEIHSEERPVIRWNAVEEILEAMTVEEKAAMLAGVDDWHLRGVPRLGVPGVQVTDCGHGVTLAGEEASPATCFPTGIGMASTWNEALLEEAGEVLGRETRALGCALLLGPKINIHRVPLNGRSFETFSEDPWLAGLLGAAVVRGIQQTGVGACLKALAANNQQRDQEKVSSDVSERALREIYLRGFELAVRHSSPAALMTSYNRINGVHASENRWLIAGVIKSEWKFPGFVVSDWRAVHSERAYGSGLDLEMPGPGTMFKRSSVLRALNEGLITPDELDDKVRRLLRFLVRQSSASEGGSLDAPSHRAAALRVAEESIVLLKNDHATLPLERDSIRRLLVVGPNAADARLGGGGSASVTPFYAISPLEGIRECAGPGIEVTYLEGCSISGQMATMEGCFEHRSASGTPSAGLKVEFFNHSEPTGTPIEVDPINRMDLSWGWASPAAGVRRGSYAARFAGEIVPPVTGTYKLGFYAQEGALRVWLDGELVIDGWTPETGDFEAKFRTQFHVIEWSLQSGRRVSIRFEYGKRAARGAVRMEWEVPGVPKAIDHIRDALPGADAVIVCAGLSNLLEGGANDRKTMDLPPAQERLIREIAGAHPKTIVILFNGGPVLTPWDTEVAALLEAWYPGQEGGRALGRILFGDTEPTGRLPDTIPHRAEDHAAMSNYPGDGQHVSYAEDLFVGYRHFDRANIEPRYPFGFGLGYTTFEVSPPSLDVAQIRAGEAVRFRVSVRNSGSRPGTTVAQLYLRFVDNPADRPVKELRAFRKISANPGESKTLVFEWDREHFERFDESTNAWRCVPGSYEILAGQHSRDLSGTRLTLI